MKKALFFSWTFFIILTLTSFCFVLAFFIPWIMAINALVTALLFFFGISLIAWPLFLELFSAKNPPKRLESNLNQKISKHLFEHSPYLKKIFFFELPVAFKGPDIFSFMTPSNNLYILASFEQLKLLERQGVHGHFFKKLQDQLRTPKAIRLGRYFFQLFLLKHHIALNLPFPAPFRFFSLVYTFIFFLFLPLWAPLGFFCFPKEDFSSLLFPKGTTRPLFNCFKVKD